MNCREAQELISPYLDGELLQFKAQMLENHLEECTRCEEALKKYRKLREEMQGMKFSEPTEDELRDARPQVVIKVTRGFGWTLTIAFLAVMGCFGLYEFITEPAVKAFEKIVVLGLILGIALLFVSVLHERIVERRTDKYKEVEK